MKKYWISIVLFLIGIGCLLVKSIVGSRLLENGVLVEPFYLIPIGYLFILLSIVVGVMTKFFYKR